MSKLVYIELSIYGQKLKVFQEQLISSRDQLFETNQSLFNVLPNRQLIRFQQYLNRFDDWENQLITYKCNQSANQLRPQVVLYDECENLLYGVPASYYDAFTLADLYQMITSVYQFDLTSSEKQQFIQAYHEIVSHPTNQKVEINLTHQAFYIGLRFDNEIGSVDFKIDLFVQDADARLNTQLLSILQSTHNQLQTTNCKLIIHTYQNDQLIDVEMYESIDSTQNLFNLFLTHTKIDLCECNQLTWKHIHHCFDTLQQSGASYLQLNNLQFTFLKELI